MLTDNCFSQIAFYFLSYLCSVFGSVRPKRQMTINSGLLNTERIHQ